MSVLTSQPDVASLYYDFHPLYNNLLEVQAFSHDLEPGGTSEDTTDIEKYLEKHSPGSNQIDRVKMYAYSISLGAPSISFKRNDFTKLFELGSYSRVDSFSISWYEDEDFTIKRFHDEWLSKFYDETNDCYISYSNPTDAARFLTKSMLVKVGLDSSGHSWNIYLKNVFPTGTGDLNFAWGSGSAKTYTMNYNVQEITFWDESSEKPIPESREKKYGINIRTLKQTIEQGVSAAEASASVQGRGSYIAVLHDPENWI